jgi:hypothetical protein
MYANYNALVNKTGVFVLLDMESCFACSEYMKELKQYNTDGWTLVAMTEEDSADLMSKEQLKTPVTRLYVNDSIEWEALGILYATQLKKLYNAISVLKQTNTNGIEKTSSTDFKIVPGSQKSLSVECFKVNEFLHIEILGQDVIAREGQWVVLYKDNHVQVFDDDEFNRRFDV